MEMVSWRVFLSPLAFHLFNYCLTVIAKISHKKLESNYEQINHSVINLELNTKFYCNSLTNILFYNFSSSLCSQVSKL